MIEFDFTIELDADLEQVFGEQADAAINELAGAIYEEMETVKAKSQEVVPLQFGVLRASADAVGVNLIRTGYGGQVVIGYGGAASGYSIIQHQTPPPGEGQEGQRTFTHAPGRTWKYLERPVLDSVDGMELRIAERIRRRLEYR